MTAKEITKEMFVEMRSQNMSLVDIAKRLNVNIHAVRTRAQQLGVSFRAFKSTRARGTAKHPWNGTFISRGDSSAR